MAGFLRLLRVHAGNFFTNWRESDEPVSTKLRLTARNRARALFRKAQCCGHPGEPGC